MPDWIETELKLLLPDEASYRRVLAALGPGRSVLQQNHFFDRTDGALRAARIGVRLRAEDAERLLTLKGDALAGPGAPALSRRIELETNLPSATFEDALRDGLDLRPWLARFRGESGAEPLPPALARFLATVEACCGDERLRCYGEFRNFRTIDSLALHDELGMIPVELAVDRTELPGNRIDHEIEVELAGNPGDPDELAERTARALLRWLADRGVDPVLPAPSKLARFHDALAGRSRPDGADSAAESAEGPAR
ncbi:MAG: CYTH domain-containing protein [Myxococcota bacterium]